EFGAEVLVLNNLFFAFFQELAIVLIFAVLKQVEGGTGRSNFSEGPFRVFERRSCEGVCGASTASTGSSKLMKMLMWSFTSLAAKPMASLGVMAPLVQTSIISFS